MVSIIALIVATTVVLLLNRAAKQRKKPSELDLQSVRAAMIEKHGWTEDRADAAQLEYVRFLTLLQKKPGFMLVPWLDSSGRDDLDQFWHQHILDTGKYAADCRALFETHDPPQSPCSQGIARRKGRRRENAPALHSNLLIRDLWLEGRSSRLRRLLCMRNRNYRFAFSLPFLSLPPRRRWQPQWP